MQVDDIDDLRGTRLQRVSVSRNDRRRKKMRQLVALVTRMDWTSGVW